MKFLVAIERGNDSTAHGIVVPDLPGCFSAGDTIEEALENAKEAIALWIETVLDEGGAIPAAQPADQWMSDPEYAGWIWAVVDVAPESLSDKAERINITLPARVLRRLDRRAKAEGETRSGMIAKLAMTE